MSIAISAVDHVAIRVKDLEVAANWYTEVLGLAVLHRWENAWMLERGASRLGLYIAPGATPPEGADKLLTIHHHAFTVTAEAMIAAEVFLAELGIPYDGPKDSGLFWSLFLTDPDGYRVELVCLHRPDEGVG
jgi:catechol-2,3-dioxygenase